MKELIKSKLDNYTDKLLAKEEITNEEAVFLLKTLSKIEREEEQLKLEKDKEQIKEMMKHMNEML